MVKYLNGVDLLPSISQGQDYASKFTKLYSSITLYVSQVIGYDAKIPPIEARIAFPPTVFSGYISQRLLQKKSSKC